jgi:hypothetical protein
VKPEPAWADFLGWSVPKINLEPRLQPGLLLSASRALVREIGHPPKGLGIPRVAARP